MSENPRKRQLENQLSIIGNEGTCEEDGNDDNNINDEEIDEYDNKEQKNQEESQNDCNNNTGDDINLDDKDKITEINDDDDDDKNYSIENDPWILWEKDDEDDYHDDCPLQRAIKKEYPISTILDSIKVFPMQVKHKNDLGEYPLHTACSSCRHGIVYVIVKLIELYPEAAQHKNSTGQYPLHIAFHFEQSDAVFMELIEVFPKPISKSSTHGNALHFVCENYDVVSETLISKLVDINPKAIHEKNFYGFYPIYNAIYSHQSIAVIKLLLDGYPLGLQRIAERDANDETIFHLAVNSDNVDLFRYLMQHSDLPINARNGYGKTPLHDSCNYPVDPRENREQIHDMILNHPDVDVNATDNFNDTPLHTTLKHYDRHSDTERTVNMIQKLLDNEFILVNEKNNDNKTPLDLIKDRVNILEEENELTPWQQNELSCLMKISQLLQEFPIKRRWLGYCYHVKNFIDCDDKFNNF